jgi:hypothetical protein
MSTSRVRIDSLRPHGNVLTSIVPVRAASSMVPKAMSPVGTAVNLHQLARVERARLSIARVVGERQVLLAGRAPQGAGRPPCAA